MAKTAQEALAEYRTQANQGLLTQVEHFRRMSASEQRELLFYMAMRMSEVVRQIVATLEAMEHKPTITTIPRDTADATRHRQPFPHGPMRD